MKFFLTKALMALLSITWLFTSCKEDDTINSDDGFVMFNFLNDSNAGRTAGNVQLNQILVSIADSSGTTIYENEILEIASFENGYLSEPLSLTPGAYELTKFLVIGEDSVVYYATPTEDSELAYLVENPLPISMEIFEDEVTKVVPEVVSTDEGDEEDFGYTEFGFEIIETFDLLMSTFIYDNTTKLYELTEASLKVYDGERVILAKELFASTNKVVLPKNTDSLKLEIEKEGYVTFEETFSIDSLLNYDGTTPEGPLEIILEPKVNVLDGLVAYYPFNGNADDASGNGFDGIVNGASLISDREGNTNSAYNFDGVDDLIDLGSNVGNGIRSVSLWFEIPSEISNTNSRFISLIARNNSFNSNLNASEFSVAFAPSNIAGYSSSAGRIVATFRDVNGKATTSFSDTNEWQSGRWYQLIIQINADTEVEIFVDGKEDLDSFKVKESNITETPDLDRITAIGAWGDLTAENRFFNGVIDDVRIYNRTLNISEIEFLSEN